MQNAIPILNQLSSATTASAAGSQTPSPLRPGTGDTDNSDFHILLQFLDAQALDAQAEGTGTKTAPDSFTETEVELTEIEAFPPSDSEEQGGTSETVSLQTESESPALPPKQADGDPFQINEESMPAVTMTHPVHQTVSTKTSASRGGAAAQAQPSLKIPLTAGRSNTQHPDVKTPGERQFPAIAASVPSNATDTIATVTGVTETAQPTSIAAQTLIEGMFTQKSATRDFKTEPPAPDRNGLVLATPARVKGVANATPAPTLTASIPTLLFTQSESELSDNASLPELETWPEQLRSHQAPLPDTARAPTSAALPATQHARPITNQVIAELSRGQNGTTEIQLAPEELGKLQLKLSTQDGIAVVMIAAERPETTEMLRRNLGDLEQQMHNLGYENVDFQFAEQQHNSRETTDHEPDSKIDHGAGHSDPLPTERDQSTKRQIVALDRMDLRL